MIAVVYFVACVVCGYSIDAALREMPTAVFPVLTCVFEDDSLNKRIIIASAKNYAGGLWTKPLLLIREAHKSAVCYTGPIELHRVKAHDSCA